MANAYTLKILIDAEDKATPKISGLSKAFQGLSNVGGVILGGGLAAAGAAITGLTAGIGFSIAEAMEAQKVQAQLNAVLASTGGVAGVTADMVNELSTSLSQVTTFSDESITSAQNMLLTFTNIGKDVFPQTTEAVLDLATATGTDLKSASIMLGKALNDPVQGVSALRRVGVSLSDEQEQLVKRLMATGKTAEAQKIILDELNKEFGGSARAIGDTLPGKIQIFRNQLSNVGEVIGNEILPVLTTMLDQLMATFNSPTVQAGITTLITLVSNFALAVITHIPVILGWLQNFFQSMISFFQENPGLIAAGLAIITAALLAFAITTISSAVPAMLTFLGAAAPVIAIMAVIGAVAYLLYQAWTYNWGGIQEKTAGVVGWLTEKFALVKAWLQDFLPKAIAVVTNFWETKLLPALQAVWTFISTYLLPLIGALANLLMTALGVAFRFIGTMITNVIVPAIQKLFEWLGEKLSPILQSVAKWARDDVAPAFQKIGDAISKAIGWIQKLTEKLGKVSLPKWLTPGSPTPLELGIRGITDAMKQWNQMPIPVVNAPARSDFTRANAPAGTAPSRASQLDEEKLAIALRDAFLRAGLVRGVR